jgi:hypothetical protein
MGAPAMIGMTRWFMVALVSEHLSHEAEICLRQKFLEASKYASANIIKIAKLQHAGAARCCVNITGGAFASNMHEIT